MVISPYLIILSLIAFAVLPSSEKRFDGVLYRVCFALLTLFLVFRFGQGTDWLGYNYIYSMAPSGSFDFADYFYSEEVHSEIGWKLINNLFKVLGFDFFWLVAFVSLLEMCLLNKFITRYSANCTMSLLLFFPIVYLTYFFSTLRQGIVIAVFLGLMVEWLDDGKVKRYVLATVALLAVHMMAIILILPLFVTRLSNKSLSTLLAGAAAVGFAGVFALNKLIAILGLTWGDNGISLVALAYRLIMAALVFFLYWGARGDLDDEDAKRADVLMKIYVCGIVVYLCFMGNAGYSSRFAAPFLAMELVLIPMFSNTANARRQILLVFFAITMVFVMTAKNLGSYLDQGYYPADLEFWEYPYVSVFNQEDIIRYSDSPYIAFL